MSEHVSQKWPQCDLSIPPMSPLFGSEGAYGVVILELGAVRHEESDHPETCVL